MDRRVKKKQELAAITLILCFILPSAVYAGETPAVSLAKGSTLAQDIAWKQSDTLLQGYCGRETLRRVLENLEMDNKASQAALSELTRQADANQGNNTLYELKQAAEKAGAQAEGLVLSKAEGVRCAKESLRLLKRTGELIVNITGNRHFALVKEVNENGVWLYIPGLNYTEPQLSWAEFLRTWDGVAIVISKNKIARSTKRNCALVSDKQLKHIYGGQPCGNVSGSCWKYAGSSGCVRGSEGNSSGQNNADSSTAPPATATKEPVVINNGNLFLTAEDIRIPTRSLPLKLKRYYNAQVVSEVTGWLPEAGAGSWVIENGEYSGQGNRSTSDVAGTDYSVELDMQTIQPGTNHTWETAWLNIRYSEDPNDPRKAKDCYYFLIHTDGKIELNKWKDGAQSYLYSKATSYRPTNKNHIKIVAAGANPSQGANIKVYINGALEINYTDTNNPVLSVGRIALESYFSHCHFDNITISAGTQSGQPQSYSYSYNFNSDDNEFIFGYGWTHSYSLRIKEYPNHVTLYRENNAREIYIPNGNGTYGSVPVNYYCKLTKDASGFSLKDKYGIHYRFSLSGQLQYIQDRNGNQTSLSYTTISGKSLLSAITEPSGRKMTLSYGTNKMVSTATDPAGNQVQYYYDAAGHLTEVRDRNGNATNYEYDPLTHNLVRLTDAEGNEFNYNYIYNDRVNDQTDPEGNTTKFDYLWSTVHVINQQGKIYKYNFDTKGFLQSVTAPNGSIERSINDTNGNATIIKDANNNSSKFSYNALSLPTSISDQKGNITTLTYDTKGNLLKAVNAEGGVTTFTYNTYGQIVSIQDPKGNLTQFTYDNYGNLATIKDAQNNITTYSYDILGQLTSVKDALGNIREYSYDDNGNLLSSKDPLGNITSYTYTEMDKLSTVTDPIGNSVRYSYDCFGNRVSVNDALGNQTSYSYDTTNQMHLNRANLLSLNDANGNTTNYVYDAVDRLIKESDAQGQTYQYSYDAQGNLIQRQDAQGQLTKYQYDNLNRLSKITYPDNSAITYTYDAVSNLAQIQDSTGLTKYTYDKINRRKPQNYPDGTILSYTYDANNNQTCLEMSGIGKINYTYDSLNRMNQITRPDGKTAQFYYDKLSRRAQLTYPNGAITTYIYDPASRLTQLINKNKSAQGASPQEMSKYIYTYNAAGDRTRIDMSGGSEQYTYDQNRQLIRELSTITSKGTLLSIVTITTIPATA